MKTRRTSALAVGLAAASLLTLGTLSQALADDHVDGSGTKQLSGCGTLTAHGSGTAHLQLNGDSTVSVNGQVTVNQDSSRVDVDDSGNWSRDNLAGDNVRY